MVSPQAVKKPNKEAFGGDAVGRVQDGFEGGISETRPFEEAQERRFRLVSAETVEEAGIREDTAPARAHGEARERVDGTGGSRRKISRRRSSSSSGAGIDMARRPEFASLAA